MSIYKESILRTILLSTLVVLTFSACSSTEEKKETVFDNKLTTVQEAKENVAAINKQITASNSTSGEVLYATKCASCHGKDAKKSALNASEMIAGWDSKKSQDALNGYLDGSYGRNMKAIMQGQVRPLTQEEIKSLSDHIATL